MSTPLENTHPRGFDDGRLIDRLVDGELAEVERRELLLRLEAEPDGWRRCALAFLEAQSWREALGPPAAPRATRAVEAADAPDRRTKLRRPAAKLAALAAGLAAAFALGWVVHRGPVEVRRQAPVAATEAPTPPAESPRPAPAEVAAHESPPSRPGQPPTLPDPVLKRLEQRGYHAELQNRLVAMRLQDGRKVEVPVQEVRLRYVGARTY